MSLLDVLLLTHRAWQKIWPLRGRYAVRHLIALIARLGLLRSSWFTVREGFSMYLDPKDYLQREILCNGIWEETETAYMRSTLRLGQVFVDVGANIGYFTLLAAKIVGECGTVLSIEPNRLSADLLKGNLERNNVRNVIIEEVASSDREQSGVLYWNDKSNCGALSLARGKRAASGQQIECWTLDRLIEKHKFSRVDFVKIDVEGAELHVLRGMASTLARFKPVLLVELEPRLLCSFGVQADDVVSYLTSIGYVHSRIDGSKNYPFSPCSEATHS